MFPAPKWHAQDGGRYIGTGSFNVTRDPDEGWINCGTYRVMIHDDKTVGFYISPGKHGRIQRDKYEARRRADAGRHRGRLRSDVFLMASSEVPYGVCEYDVVGGIRGKPVDVVKGADHRPAGPGQCRDRHRGLRPARQRAGPRARSASGSAITPATSRDEPVIDIKAIYHRNDPILLGCAPQRPPDEIARYRALDALGARCARTSPRPACPTSSPPGRTRSAPRGSCSASPIRQRYPGHAHAGRPRRGHVPRRRLCGRYVIVVDDDIDVSNLEELIWAMLTRSDPATSIDIIRNAWSTPLDPRIEPERKAKGDFTNSRAIIDACRPWHWRDQFPKVNMPSAEERRIGTAEVRPSVEALTPQRQPPRCG